MTNDLTQLSQKTHAFLSQEGQLFIGGEWRKAASGLTLEAIDPSSGLQIASIARASAIDVFAAVNAASATFESGVWSRMPPLAREKILHRLADLMEENLDTLAELETVDVGQPIWLSKQLNVSGAISSLRYMAGWASKIHGETIPVGVPIPGANFFGYTTLAPVGVVAAIIPWNVPVMLAIWKLAPALAAGCTVVLKPSEDASLAVLFLAKLIEQAGFPPGTVNVITGTGIEVGEPLVSHDRIAKITFTGSTATGKAIGRVAAEKIKKVSLELGGKSPQLLFKDADLDSAIPGIAGAIFLNSGQVCVSGSRLYVEHEIYDEVVQRLADHADKLRVGAGLDPQTEIGPLVSKRHFDKVDSYVKCPQGETVTRRKLEDGPGYYVPPTVIAGLKQDDKVMAEEIFGPVLGVSSFSGVDEAIALANDSPYGLSACVWTRDLSTAFTMSAAIRSGKVAINSEPMPYPGLPEGGVKASGYGRDLGKTSVESYCELKSVLIRI